MDEAVRCSRLGFMYAGRLLTTGSPRELMAPLAGRILELRAQPKGLARQICQADPDVEDVATFGELLHLRLRNRGAGSRRRCRGRRRPGSVCPTALAAAGVQVQACGPSRRRWRMLHLLLQAGRAQHLPGGGITHGPDRWP